MITFNIPRSYIPVGVIVHDMIREPNIYIERSLLNALCTQLDMR